MAGADGGDHPTLRVASVSASSFSGVPSSCVSSSRATSSSASSFAAGFVEVLDAYLAARAEVARWRPPSWWERLWSADATPPEVPHSVAASAAAVLALLRGREIAAVRERASGLVDDGDAAARDAACAYLDRPRSADAATHLVEEFTGMVFLWVPPGCFVMGSADDDREANPWEKPARSVTIAEGFFLGQHPVTDAAYESFVQATGRRAPGAWPSRASTTPRTR